MLRRMMPTKEAAHYVGLATGTLANMRVRGDGPRFRKIAGRVLYDVADLDAWIDDHPLVVSTSDDGAVARSA